VVNGARILKTAITNMVSPGSYDNFRLAAAPAVERASRAGVTQLLDPFEGEGVDAYNSLAARLRSLPVRTGLGAVGGATRAGVQYGPGGAVAGAGLGAAEGALSTIISPGLWQRFIPTVKLMTFDIDGRLLFDPRDYDVLKLAISTARQQSIDPLRRFVGNRLSVPLSLAAEQGANTQYVGLGAYEPPITKPAASVRDQFLQRATQAAGLLASAGATTPIQSYERTGPTGGALSVLTGGRMTSQSVNASRTRRPLPTSPRGSRTRTQ
jgi:hypothetical protein